MKDIPHFEERYAITKKGRVWAYPHTQSGFNCIRHYKGKWIKPYKMGDYLGVQLLGERHYIHRLIGFTYHSKTYFAGAVINHKDEDRFNNSKKNIEWVTQAQNVQHSMHKRKTNTHWKKRKRDKYGKFK